MNANILLVEDEQALQMAVGDRLRKEGYVVDCASDAEMGFCKATSQPFDLMIFDIMLPRRSGLDLCRDVRNVGLGTPILLLSAYHQAVVKTTGFEVGADDYVTKPFDMLELSARVEALLRRALTNRTSARSDNRPQLMSGRQSERAQGQAAIRDSRLGALNPRDSQGFEGRNDAQKDFSRLAEVIPRLHKMLEQEQQSPQTPDDALWLGVAEGILNFLEQVFVGHYQSRNSRSL